MVFGHGMLNDKEYICMCNSTCFQAYSYKWSENFGCVHKWSKPGIVALKDLCFWENRLKK